MSNAEVRQAVLEAGVRQEGHIALNSGRHSDVKLDMEQLLKRRNAMRLRAVMSPLAEEMQRIGYDLTVPVPNGMLALTRAAEEQIPSSFPRVVDSAKYGKRKFEFSHPAARALIVKAGRIAISDDALTTGGTPLAMAAELRRLGSEAELDLYAIWRRDTLRQEVGQVFGRQFYLVEETIPSWPARECYACPLE